MRLGTFVLGGLAGAAVVMLMRNQAVTAVTNGFGQMLKHRMNEMKETAIEKGMNVKFGGGILGMQTKNALSTARNSQAHTGGLEQVEHLASKDPNVKHEIKEILNQNGQHHI